MVRSTGSAVLPAERTGSPGSLIVSFAGSYLRELGGWIGVADLINCLGAAELSPTSVRQALVRLKSRGFLMAERRSGDAGYALTPAGRHDLATGDRRIYRHGQAAQEAGWVLAVFSVPEPDRHLRHRLRTELSWLGFGTVASGVWVAPRPLTAAARDLLTAAGLDGYVTWFAADHLSDINVAAWWDLAALRARYVDFLSTWQPQTGRFRVPDDQAFARYLRLIDAWRLFPRLDPGLPAAMLPDGWPAHTAWEVFRDLREAWCEGGWRFVRAVAAHSVDAPA